MEWQAIGPPAAAIITAILTFLGTRHVARLERSREEARIAEAARDEASVVEKALSEVYDRSRAAIVTERNELLERWQRTLDEARDERRRLMEEHRLEISRVRQETRDEVADAREGAQLVVGDLREQLSALRAELERQRAAGAADETGDAGTASQEKPPDPSGPYK
jgi:hypothetical protein